MTAFQTAQGVAEVLIQANPKYAVAQTVAEVLIQAIPKMAAGQIVIEVLLDPGGVNVECAQVVAEVLCVIPTATTGAAAILHL